MKRAGLRATAGDTEAQARVWRQRRPPFPSVGAGQLRHRPRVWGHRLTPSRTLPSAFSPQTGTALSRLPQQGPRLATGPWPPSPGLLPPWRPESNHGLLREASSEWGGRPWTQASPELMVVLERTPGKCPGVCPESPVRPPPGSTRGWKTDGQHTGTEKRRLQPVLCPSGAAPSTPRPGRPNTQGPSGQGLGLWPACCSTEKVLHTTPKTSLRGTGFCQSGRPEWEARGGGQRGSLTCHTQAPPAPRGTAPPKHLFPP